jgi:hypothetical protein
VCTKVTKSILELVKMFDNRTHCSRFMRLSTPMNTCLPGWGLRGPEMDSNGSVGGGELWYGPMPSEALDGESRSAFFAGF